MNSIINQIKKIPIYIFHFLKEYTGKISARVLGWVTIVLLHFASVPTLLAILMEKSDKLPPVDIMIFIWGALTTLFFKALFERNLLYVATICLGFAAQTILMSLILFR